MALHDGQTAPTPTPTEAFETLQQLADVFLRGGARPADTAAEAEDDRLPRPATIIVDREGRVQGLDSEAERLLNCRASDVLGAATGSVLAKLPAAGERLHSHAHRLDGTEVAVWVTRTDVIFGGQAHAVLSLHEQDLWGDRRAALRYQHLVEQIPAVVFTAALDGGLYDIYVGPQIENLLGYSQAEWVADPVLWYERLHPDDRRTLDEEFARGCITGGPFRADCRFLTRDDRLVWVHGEARLIKDERGIPVLLQGVAFDITETKRAEEVAKASLREKETLLKEIHHRVKNNLQVTSSLLKLQAERVQDESARHPLREAQNRVRSMALVHELLYRSKDLASVELGEYVRNLTRQLLRTHGVQSSKVGLEIDVAAVPLPIDIAVPCGLILNELVSNALRHAFPDERAGTIHVELRSAGASNDLVVRDDGVGMPADVDLSSDSTLGLRLVRTLANQIDGRLTFRKNGGTEVLLSIPRQEQRE